MTKATGEDPFNLAGIDGDLAHRVVVMMEAAHLTLDRFATALGCTKDMVWRLRMGKTRKIDLGLLFSIAKWAYREGYSLEWMLLGIGPAIRPTAVGQEREKAVQITNRAAVIIGIGAMAKGLGIDLGDISAEWARQMSQGQVPEINGTELLERLSQFIKEQSCQD